ncbi:hypothetical protein BD777DRAFT_130430 [Yarrowia lipolytica]|nr:hypothetical protein BD777DRAFT_130430 [Yarrowia lipolytica]
MFFIVNQYVTSPEEHTLYQSLFTTNTSEDQGRLLSTKKNSGTWFRSRDIRVMSPARFRCAMPLI